MVGDVRLLSSTQDFEGQRLQVVGDGGMWSSTQDFFVGGSKAPFARRWAVMVGEDGLWSVVVSNCVLWWAVVRGGAW